MNRILVHNQNNGLTSVGSLIKVGRLVGYLVGYFVGYFVGRGVTVTYLLASKYTYEIREYFI